MIKALVVDEMAHRSCRELNEAAFQTFLGEVTDALEQERRQLQQGHLRSWKDWVTEAERAHKG